MTVTLTCDLCRKTQILTPGEHSSHIGSAKGWDWRRASSYSSQIVIIPLTICADCSDAISAAKVKAETETKIKLSLI